MGPKLREDGFLPSFQTTECARGGAMSHDRFLSSAINPHLQTFMSRNAPVTDTPLQFSTFDESKTTTHYAKDCRGTVLITTHCGCRTAHPRNPDHTCYQRGAS